VTARDRTILIVVCVVAAIGAAWLLVISPKRNEASKLGSQLSAAQSELDTARSQAAANQAARAAFAANYTTIARLGEAVPTDDNVPSLIYQLQGAAHRARVDFVGIQLVPNGGSSSSADSSTGTPSSSPSLPPGATAGTGGFDSEPFTFTFQGNFFHLADFLGRLQRFVIATNKRVAVSGRLLTLNALNLGAGPQGFPQVQASVSATTYLVPKSQSLMNGATPAGPAASSTQTVSNPSSGGSASPTAAVAPPVP
jgi:type II secretory pathway pseudopilin PulG